MHSNRTFSSFYPTRRSGSVARVALAAALCIPCALPCALTAQKPGKPEAFAAKPYMGWSCWSLFRKDPSEASMKAQADALIANGLREYGYLYVNLDDFSEDPHDPYDAHGYAKPDAKRFPTGYAGLASYMHQHGLKFGFYLNTGITKTLYALNPQIAGTDAHIQDIADTTQAGNTRGDAYRIDFTKPAAVAYFRGYADQLAAWGVDFLKLDFVGPGGGNVKADNREEVHQWHLALEGTAKRGHPIWLELSNFMNFETAPLWHDNANGWRIENDIECYRCPNGRLTSWKLVSERFADAPRWAPFAGPGSPAGGGWSDLDTLEIGNGDVDGLTPDERRSAYTLWAISAAPLYLGTDLTKMDKADLEILTNREVIAVDQAGIPAVPVSANGTPLPTAVPPPAAAQAPATPASAPQIWMAKYPDGSAVVALFNLGAEAVPATLDLPALGLPGRRVVRDLWARQDVPPAKVANAASLRSHACLLFRVSAYKK